MPDFEQTEAVVRDVLARREAAHARAERVALGEQHTDADIADVVEEVSRNAQWL